MEDDFDELDEFDEFDEHPDDDMSRYQDSED